MTKAFILAAGEGTRLRPLTAERPKPMLPVGGRPALEHIVRWLHGHGVRDVAINLHHHGEAIVAHFGDGASWDVRITYSPEATLLGSAGALRARMDFCDAPLAVVYGDVLTDLHLGALAALHASHRQPGVPHLTVALHHVEHPTEKGIVALDGGGRIVRFVEKPAPEEVFSDLANAGVLIVEPELIATIPAGRPYDIGSDWLPQLLAAGVPVYGWTIPDGAYLIDFGTPETYARVGREWPRRVAVFLDRDGVINENRAEYVRSWEQVRFLDGSLDALRALATTPLRTVIVSNQSGIGRGVMTAAQVEDINARLVAAIRAAGGRIDGVYVCPHRPDEECNCRKPRPGLLLQAAADLGLSPRRSYFVGDHRTDLYAAWAAGAQAVLVRTGLGRRFAAELSAEERGRCVVVDDLPSATRWILDREGITA